MPRVIVCAGAPAGGRRRLLSPVLSDIVSAFSRTFRDFGGGFHAGDSGHGRPSWLRDDVPSRQMVGSATQRVPRTLGVRRLCDVGGVPGRALSLRAVPLAVLLARALRRLAARVVRPEARLVARRGCRSRRRCSSCRFPAASASPATTTAAPTTRRSGPIRRRARSVSRARATCGENSFPLILQNVHRFFMWVALVFIALLAYDAWKAFWFANPATGADRVRHRRRHARARRQRRAAGRLHLGLPRAAPRGRRTARRGLEVAGLRHGLRVRVGPQRAASALRLVQPVLGGVRRPLRPPVLDGRAGPT